MITEDTPYIVVGMDLSGPRNIRDTVAVVFEAVNGRLAFREWICGAGDRRIYETVCRHAQRLTTVIGIDAPLSYNIGGGDRPADRSLRQVLIRAGMPPGSVMVPTLTRMAYLTLRGMAVSRMFSEFPGKTIRVVEVHPAGAMVLRGAPVGDVIRMKQSSRCRTLLVSWLERQGLEGLAAAGPSTDHHVAACAAVLAAWKWFLGCRAWIHPSDPPYHPYDLAC